jgi:hypothetical protein
MHIVGLLPGAPVPRALQTMAYAAILIELNSNVCTLLHLGKGWWCVRL